MKNTLRIEETTEAFCSECEQVGLPTTYFVLRISKSATYICRQCLGDLATKLEHKRRESIHREMLRQAPQAMVPVGDEEERLQALDKAGRLCCNCWGEFDPELLIETDLDPGDAEVGPQPNIARYCADCAFECGVDTSK